jgi:AcrR family transcriptional regulator
VPPPNAGTTARERARRELTAEIVAAGRRQVAASGPAALSLRAVARELGMASSAVYRYFATRDELLTALIVEAYDGLGDAVEAAADPGAGPGAGRSARERWTAACSAVRDWARAHPHEYALLHGSPVPGYAAPQDTVAPGVRVPLALLAVVRGRASVSGTPLDPVLEAQAHQVSDTAAVGVPPAVLVAVAAAWASVFGLVSFELFGQFRGSFDDAGPLFAHAVADLADRLGL